ncbi:MAG: hypothetical protein CMB96_04430 [Flavobacteriaceae bacterium]|nr:hypothetical protein [Flavobacteriaceae bacterium]
MNNNSVMDYSAYIVKYSGSSDARAQLETLGQISRIETIDRPCHTSAFVFYKTLTQRGIEAFRQITASNGAAYDIQLLDGSYLRLRKNRNPEYLAEEQRTAFAHTMKSVSLVLRNSAPSLTHIQLDVSEDLLTNRDLSKIDEWYALQV